jgi:hypothetical protein
MESVSKFIRWCRAPHWTRHLVIAAVAVYLIVAWSLTGTFWRGVAAGLISAGLLAGARAARWIVARVRLERDNGVPFSLVRTVRELWDEHAKFTETDERWATFTRGQKIAWNGMSPKLHRKQVTSTGDVRASINPSGLGGNLDAITRLAADGTMAGIMHCREVSVQPTEHGSATVTFYNSPPLNRAFTLADLPQSGKRRISFGVAEEGGAASIRAGLSALIVSTSGGGKSILFKNMFADIRRDNRPTWMYFVDPKRMELARFKDMVGKWIGNIYVAGYCNTAAEAEVMFARFAEEMHQRQERLAAMGLLELKDPTPDFPDRMIVIDEGADVRSTFAKMDQPLPITVSQGRATHDSMIMLAQVAKIETLGTIRDLVGIRIGLRMMTPENTKAALAISEDLAPCSRIPMATPGVGYYVTDEGTVGKFRTTQVTPKQWDDLLAGKLPEGMPVNVEDVGPPCFVYLAPDSKSGRIDYIGVAGGVGDERHPVARRRAQHRRYDRVWCVEHERVENFWRVHLNDRKMQVKKYPSRSAALIAEERLIKELRPRWNIVHNSGNPFSNFNLAKRAGAARRLRDAAGEYRAWGRDHRAARRAELAEAHQERVARLRAERDQFVQTVTHS